MGEITRLQTVRGTHDLYSEELMHHQAIIQLGREQSRLVGCEEVQTPIFEFSEVFSRTLGEASDIVNKEMYTFQDRGGDSITLRPEGTAGVARAFIANGWAQKKPLRLFYAGPMFRYERPQKGRLRQFHQMGVEFLGEESPEADIECIALGSMILERLQLKNSPTLHLNSIGDVQSRADYRSKLIGFLAPLKSQLSPESQVRLEVNPLRILDSKSEADQEILKGAPRLQDCLSSEAKAFFDRVQEGLAQLKIEFKIDSQLVRGLDYYSHTVFEFKSSALGAQDTLLAGGRYDQLIAQMGGSPTPSVGWAAGIERLALASESAMPEPKPLALVPLGEVAEKKAIELAFELRKQGLFVLIVRGGNLSKKMKKADRLKASQVVLFGEEELSRGEWILKNLTNGEQKKMDSDALFSELTNSRSN